MQKIRQFFGDYYYLHLISFLKTFISVFIVIASLQLEQGADMTWTTFWLPAAAGAVRAAIKVALGDIKI